MDKKPNYAGVNVTGGIWEDQYLTIHKEGSGKKSEIRIHLENGYWVVEKKFSDVWAVIASVEE